MEAKSEIPIAKEDPKLKEADQEAEEQEEEETAVESQGQE